MAFPALNNAVQIGSQQGGQTASSMLPNMNPQQQQSLMNWGDITEGASNAWDSVTGFFGFGEPQQKLQFPEAGIDYTQPQLDAMKVNNNALNTQATQSLSKWNAVGNVFSGVTGLANIYMGMEKLDLAQEQMKFTKEAYQTNLKNQKADYNRQLQERRRRYLSRSGESSDLALKSYMDQHGL